MKRVKDFTYKKIAQVKCLYFRFESKLKRKRNVVKFWLSDKYLLLFELLTLKLVLLTNKVVRKYIFMKGKDPDYVAPPPTLDDVWGRPSPRLARNPFVNFGVKNEWVTNLSKHPVLKLRDSWVPPIKNYKPVTQEEPLQVTRSTEDIASTEDELRALLEVFNSDPEITKEQTETNEE